MQKIKLNDPNVLRDITAPVLVRMSYINGSYSRNPHEESERLVLIDDTSDGCVRGSELSDGGQYKTFARHRIASAVVLGVMLPAQTIIYPEVKS